MKKYLLLILVFIAVVSAVQAQKKVAAVVNFTGHNTLDSLTIEKGQSFVVQLPVRNRAGDDWELVPLPLKCNFTQSMIGQAGTLPNQPEPKLLFFKAAEKGVESIHFIYKNPKTADGKAPEEKVLLMTIE